MNEELVTFILKYLDPNFFAKAFSYCFWYWLFLTVLLIIVLKKK